MEPESWNEPTIGPYGAADSPFIEDSADPSPFHHNKDSPSDSQQHHSYTKTNTDLSSPSRVRSHQRNLKRKSQASAARAARNGVTQTTSPLKSHNKHSRRSQKSPASSYIDDDTEHFRQYVSTNKNPSGAAFLRKRTLKQKYLSPASKMHQRSRGQNRPPRGAPSRSPGAGHSRSPLDTSSHAKPQWNGRNKAAEPKIPPYDAARDKHLRRHRRRMQKKSRISAAYKTAPPRSFNGRRSIRSTNSAQSPHHASTGRRVKNAWTASTKENLDPNAAGQITRGSPMSPSSGVQKTIKDLQIKVEEQTRLLETRDNDLKQVRHEKALKDRLVEKIKVRYRKLKETGASLKDENEQLQEKMKRLSLALKKKKSAAASSGSNASASGSQGGKASLKEKYNRQKQQVSQLQNELNMFKTQNQMLRAQEKEARDTSQNHHDYVEELMRMRKHLRIEKERVRKLKERLDDKQKSSQRVDKLRNYLEREKKDASKTQALHSKLQQQFDELQTQYGASQKKIEAMNQEKKELGLKLQQLKEVLLSQKRKIESLETDNIDLGQKIMNMEKSTSGVAKAKNIVQRQVKEKEEDLKRVARRVAQLEKEKSDVEMQYSTLRSEFDLIKTKCQEMEGKLQNMKGTQQSANEAAAQNQQLAIENERLKSDLKQWKQKHTAKMDNERTSKLQTKKELDNAQKELRKLRDEVKSLRHDQANKEQTISTMQSEKDILQQKLSKEASSSAEVDDLKRKLQEVTDRCSVLSESNSLLLLRLKREEAKREKN